jgi:hypothetical protein
LPSHIGTAVGGFGFGFSSGAAGASLTALVQAEMNGRQHIKARPAKGITRGKNRTCKRDTLLKTETGYINPQAARRCKQAGGNGWTGRSIFQLANDNHSPL